LRSLLREIERIANDVAKEERTVVVNTLKREAAEKYVENFHESLKILPSQVQDVRIVEIKDRRACACGGTHLKSTGKNRGYQSFEEGFQGQGHWKNSVFGKKVLS